MGVNISQQGVVKASGDGVNPNLFNWNNKGNKVITLNTYQNVGSFTQFSNCLIFDPSTTIGTQYTISFFAKSPNGTTSLKLYNSNSSPRYFYFNTVVLTNSLDSEWQFFTCTFTNRDRGSGSEAANICRRIEIYCEAQIGCQVKNIKIEQGSVATPWVPASTDPIYVGDSCGFTEIGATQCSFGQNYIIANELIEI